jgi:zinc D-Ala-D-Ala dipeptidase
VLVLAFCASDPEVILPAQPLVSPAERLLRANQLGLVEVQRELPGLAYAFPYQTAKNITRQVLYPQDMPCLLHPSTAAKLRVAREAVRLQGYDLKLWDAWRPPEVQLNLFDHGSYTGMFTDPSIMWSRHCSGTAVDVTLVDHKGREVKMPTAYDSGGVKASYIYQGNDKEVRKNLHVLQMAMLQAGFSILDTEWWHFDDGEFNARPVPPVVFADDIGLILPKVKPKKKASSL